MFCPKCGQPVKSEAAVFCAYCGEKIGAVKAAENNKDAAALSQGSDSENAINGTPSGNPAFFDPDATVRVPDETIRRYTLNRDAKIIMPEPVEESVFDISEEEPVQPVAEKSIGSNDDNKVESGFAFNGDFGATMGGGYNAPAHSRASAAYEKKAPARSSDDIFVYESPVLNSYKGEAEKEPPEKTKKNKKERKPSEKKKGKEAAGHKPAAPSSPGGWYDQVFDGDSSAVFSQPDSDGNGFFVRQVPVYEQAEQNKLKPSTLIIIIVLGIVLFAAAVTGGVFAAQAILNNAAINSIPAAFDSVEGAAAAASAIFR